MHLVSLFFNVESGAIKSCVLPKIKKIPVADVIIMSNKWCKRVMESRCPSDTTTQAWPALIGKRFVNLQPNLSSTAACQFHMITTCCAKDETMEEAISSRSQGGWWAATGQVGVSLSSLCRGVFPYRLALPDEAQRNQNSFAYLHPQPVFVKSYFFHVFSF